MVRNDRKSKVRLIRSLILLLVLVPLILSANVLTTNTLLVDGADDVVTIEELEAETAEKVEPLTRADSGIDRRTDIENKIRHYADYYGVSFERMYLIVECETAHTLDPNIQSMVRYSFSDSRRGIIEGEREMSYGLAQIHLPDHPTITLEQATDPDFSLNFMASELSKGHRLWYCEK